MEDQIQTDTVYTEPTPDPTREQLEIQTKPSAPMYGFKAHLSNSLTKVVPFVYPALQQPPHQYNDNQPLVPDNPTNMSVTTQLNPMATIECNQRAVRRLVSDKHPYPNLGFDHETSIHTINPFSLFRDCIHDISY